MSWGVFTFSHPSHSKPGTLGVETINGVRYGCFCWLIKYMDQTMCKFPCRDAVHFVCRAPVNSCILSSSQVDKTLPHKADWFREKQLFV